MHAAQMRGISKHYWLGRIEVPAIHDASIDIAAGRFTVLSGPSGSGKSTLLNLLGGIDRPSTGSIRIANHDIATLSDDALSAFRARHLGFIFQNFNLIPILSAFENVEYPLRLQRMPAAQRRARVLDMLDAVGLADRLSHRPAQLSGGQRQRVAIARALAHRPSLVIADEPTANLDSQTGAAILALLQRLQREQDIAVVFSSHDPQVIATADTLYEVRDGRVTPASLHASSPTLSAVPAHAHAGVA